MNDRTWLLTNNAALVCARRCIEIVRKEAGIKLTLADKDLLKKIGAISKNIDSITLDTHYRDLLNYAGIKVLDANEALHQLGEKLHDVGEKLHDVGETLHDATHNLIGKIEYHGKEYPRFDAQGREFKGVYRGAVRYG